MRDRLIHRGPDYAGLRQSADDRVRLGHRRLASSIHRPTQINLSCRAMAISWPSSTVRSTTRSLRRELERAGVSFRPAPTPRSSSRRTRPGEPNVSIGSRGCLPSRLGPSASEADLRARPGGGEALYYAVVDGSFIFASELKALLAWPRFRRDRLYVGGRLPDARLYRTPSPSGWERALPPGHWLEVDLTTDGPAAKAPSEYWDLQFERTARRTTGAPIRETLSRLRPRCRSQTFP